MAPSSLFCNEQPLNITKALHKHNKSELNSISFSYLSSLITNQTKSNFSSAPTSRNNSYLNFARKQSVEWIKTTSQNLKFNTSTVLLAVNYLDRCFMISNGFCLKQEKPWMSQLSAVACLSLAAKYEESYVPSLLDIQLSNDQANSFVFDSKTVKRMELLVLSTLGWRMSSPTSLAFIQCLSSNSEVLRRCECVLLDVLSDCRWLQHSPAVWAAATMQYSMGQHLDEMNNIFNQLDVSKETVQECYALILEIIDSASNKRRNINCYCEPESPTEVIGSWFSFEKTSSISALHEAAPSKRAKCVII